MLIFASIDGINYKETMQYKYNSGFVKKAIQYIESSLVVKYWEKLHQIEI